MKSIFAIILFLAFTSGPKHNRAWYGQHADKYIKMTYKITVNLIMQNVLTVECYNTLNIDFRSITFKVTFEDINKNELNHIFITPEDSWIGGKTMKTVLVKVYAPLESTYIACTIDNAYPENIN